MSDLDKLTAEIRRLTEEMRDKAQEETLDRKDLLARVENLDRSIQEICLTFQQAEISRKREWEMVKGLLGEERTDRRTGVKDASTRTHEGRTLLVSGIKAVWNKGGQWVVAAICLLLVLQMQRCSGTEITKLLGIGG